MRPAALMPTALILAAALAPLPLLADCPGRITVQGAAEVRAVPDMLRLIFRAEAEAGEPAAALAEASRRTRGMLEAVAAEGVAPADMATVEVSLHPISERPTREEAPRIIAWRAASGAAVTLRDLDRFGALLTAATRAGATGLSGFSFEVSTAEALLAEARALAVTDALARATQMADAAGLQLGAVLEISDFGGHMPRPFAARGMALEAAADMPLAAGESSLSAQVGLTAELCR